MRSPAQMAQLKALHAANQGRWTARREAREQGKTHYEGRPCKLGHTLRLVSTAHCVECNAIYMKEWGLRCDPDYTLRRGWQRSWRARNPDKLKRQRSADPEYTKAYMEWWRETKDPDGSRRREYYRTYRKKNALKLAQRRADRKSSDRIAHRKAVEQNTLGAIMGTLG